MTRSRISYGELLRGNRTYRSLWFAEIVSFLGDWFNTIALYTIVQDLSGSGRAIAAVMVAKMLPIFLVAPIAGPLVDRFDRRKLLIASDIVRSALTLVLIAAHRAENLTLLYCALVLMVATSGIFIPARSAAIPQITTPRELAVANALSGGTWSVMLAFGAALGGWVTQTLGVDWALLLDALTFLVSAAFLIRLPALPAPGIDMGHDDRSFLGGLRYLASHRRAIALAGLKPLMALGGGAVLMIPIYGTAVFPAHGGPMWVGILYSARGLGALIGSMLLIRIFGDKSRTLRRMLLVAFPLAAISYIALSRAPSLPWAAVAYLTAAIASGANWVFSSTLIQREIDHRYLGRVFSVEFGMMTLSFAATSWAAGSLMDATSLGPRDIARLSAFLLVIPFTYWAAHLLRERRLIRAGVAPEG